MAKSKGKKKNIRLRRQIRRTMGAVCLITALLVAAIPVPEARAAGDPKKYLWDEQIGIDKTKIPLVDKDCNTIYTTADGRFQFAWVEDPENAADMIAVILGYSGGTLTGNKLVIDDTFDAYTRYRQNIGGGLGYVAVGRNHEPLYYQVSPAVYEKDVSTGDEILVSQAVYSPCYSTESVWKRLNLEDFYYRDADGEYIGADGYTYSKTESFNEQWIKDITVKYIGNQSLMLNPDASESATGAVQTWVIAEDEGKINTNPENGVFAGEGNILELEIGEHLVGIGNYAFYGCRALYGITLGNGLLEVGKYAFANCSGLTDVNIPYANRMTYISDYTFYGCTSLVNFRLSQSVETIYDHAFDGCSQLGSGTIEINGKTINSLNLTGEGEKNANALQRLGYGVFNNCGELKEVTLPLTLTEAVDLNNFRGCSKLEKIVARNKNTSFEAATGDDAYTVEDFKNGVLKSFYFEAEGDSATHEFTKKNAIAFKYSDQDLYEIIIREAATDGGVSELTYQVTSQNDLHYFNMTKPVKEVEIPSAIGPYGISKIGEGSFSDNCFLEKITIPATVEEIQANAFRGCHNLKDVIFANAASIRKPIGEDAFATQVVSFHADNCTNKDFLTKNLSPTLTFTGTVGAGIEPFEYAMNGSHTINEGNQAPSYITYYSGWPANLEVKYVVDRETGKGAATLVDYPTYAELQGGKKYTVANYPYITADYEKAAEEAIAKYEKWLAYPETEVTDNQWQIINAALKLSVPSGVKAVATGLFSGVTGTDNGDGTYTITPVSGQSIDSKIQEITLADVQIYEPYMFSGCKELKKVNITGGANTIADYAFANDPSIPNTDLNLTSVDMTGGGGSIGNYAFCNNPKLSNVRLSATVSSLGLRPFKDCPLLENVDFSGGPNFVTEQAIIYGLKNGSKDSVVQCLESRGKLKTPGSISKTELAGVTSLAPEAFMDCEEIGSVDLSSTAVQKIPDKAFYNTSSLYSVTLPTTCGSVSKNAFGDSNVRYVDIPSSVSFIDPTAFNTAQNPSTDVDKPYNSIEFYCEPGSAAAIYAGEYDNINVTDKPATTTFKVIFWDYDNTIIDEQDVLIGTDAKAPADPVREGYTFEGWLPANFTAVSRPMDIVAQYTKIDSEDKKFTVRFIDYDDTVLYTQRVSPGEDAYPPQAPVRDGYVFKGWRPAITDITKDTDTYAQYEKITDSNGGNGSGNGSGSGNGNGSVSGGNGNTSNPTLYTLTVKNGSGSGSYAAGATVIIVADEPAKTQEFSKWTTDSSGLQIASTSVAATTLVMPAANTTVTANFTNKSNSGSGGSNTSSGGNNTVSGNNTGTVIVIDKNGLSNTGVVSATIKGSSDNFVIKVTEDASASEAIVEALMAEYGSLDNIKYFPMDISLYDSTGRTKITDTSGLSISITLPLPDSMITYAGNNKVAGVVNGRLDKLTPKFTTIDGVSCVTFTAEHFSPYVIYVDTSNLESLGVTDSSPKTGDIHPKWFFVIGLTCMAVILFAKKDKTGKKILVEA